MSKNCEKSGSGNERKINWTHQEEIEVYDHIRACESEIDQLKHLAVRVIIDQRENPERKERMRALRLNIQDRLQKVDSILSK